MELVTELSSSAQLYGFRPCDHFSSQSMAEQGLHYNVFDGWYCCIHCDAVIDPNNHEDCDAVLREHVRQSPDCQHLLKTKGKQCIQDIQVENRRARILLLENEDSRVETFTRWSELSKWMYGRFCPKSLAEQGLYCDESGQCRCFDCDAKIDPNNHKDCDEVLREHVRQSPDCQHLLETKAKQYIQNIIQVHLMLAVCFGTPNGSKQPEYINKTSAVDTYTKRAFRHKPFSQQSLAKQGLYHMGGGQGRCFHCDAKINLDNHEDYDAVLREHVRQSPDCQHLLKTIAKQCIHSKLNNIRDLERTNTRKSTDTNTSVLPEKDPGIVVTVGPGKSGQPGDIYRMRYADLQAGDGRHNNPQYMKCGNGDDKSTAKGTRGNHDGGGATGGGATGGATGGGATGATGGGWPPSSKERSSGQSDDGHSGEEFGGGREGSKTALPEGKSKGHQDFYVGANIRRERSRSMEVCVVLGPYDYVERKTTHMEPLRQTEGQEELSISCHPFGTQSQHNWIINGDKFQPGNEVSKGVILKFDFRKQGHTEMRNQEDKFLIKVYRCHHHIRTDEVAKILIETQTTLSQGTRERKSDVEFSHQSLPEMQVQCPKDHHLEQRITAIERRLETLEMERAEMKETQEAFQQKFKSVSPSDDSQQDFPVQ